MAMHGQIPIEFGMVFPAGAYAAGGIEMVRDFDRSSGDRVVQQADKHTGLPLWVVEVIDADPDARQRTVKVKIAAQVQPVLPSPAPGSPFTAVEFDGMTATPYVDASRCSGDGKSKCGARVAVHRSRVRRHDRHPLGGFVPLLGRRQAQVRRPPGVLLQSYVRAGSVAGDRPSLGG